MDPEEFELLSAIKRSAAVLLLLSGLGRAAGEKEVATLLGMNQETARGHLRSLHTLGLIARKCNHNGYTLTRSGKRLVQRESAEDPRHYAEKPRQYADDPRFWGSTTSSAFNSRKRGNRRAAVVVESESAENPRNCAENPRIDAENPRFHATIHSYWKKRNRLSGVHAAELLSALQAANLAALRAEGLGMNHRVQRVCRLPHVTPEYVAGQARRLRQERRFAATLLLHIVESGDPLPPPLDPYQEEAEDRQRYIRGPYADIIDH